MLPEMSEATQKTPRIAAGIGMGIGNTSTCSGDHTDVINRGQAAHTMYL